MAEREHVPFPPGEPTKQLVPVFGRNTRSFDANRMVIAERLRAARIAARLTQEEVAGGLYSKSYLSALERGKMIPSLQALTALSERLAVPVAYLLGEIDIDPSVLAESSALLRLPAESTHPTDETAAMLRLGNAEEYIRKDQPQRALEALGGGDEPPALLPLIQHPQWYWLAGWVALAFDKPLDAIRLLERGFHLAVSLRLRVLRPQHPHMLDELVERLRCYLGIAYCANDQTDLALQHHLQGLAAIDKNTVTDVELKLMIYKGLGHNYLALARYPEAIKYYQLALGCAQDRADQRQYGLAAWGLGMASQWQGNFVLAKKSYQEALEALGKHGNLHILVRIRAVLGQMLANLKEYKEAEHHLQRSLEGARQTGDSHLVVIAQGNLAELYLSKGETAQAIQVAQEALHLAHQIKYQRAEGELQYTLATAYAAIHNSEAAEQAFQEAIQTAEQIHDPDLLNRVQQRYADFLAAVGRYQEAFAVMQQMPSPSSGEQQTLERSPLREDWASGPLE